LAGAAAVSLFGCGRGGNGASDPRVFSLAHDLWSGYYPAALAEAMGLLDAEGIGVRMIVPGSTDRMLAEFHAGRHDLIACSIGDVIPMAGRSRDIAIVLSSDESSGGDQIFRRRDFDPAGAELLRLGTDFSGFGELFMRDYLAHAGLGERRIQWLHVDASEVGAALDAGSIDIGNCWEPFASAVARAGHVRVFDSSQTPGLITQVVVAKRRLIEAERPRLQGFCRAWFAATDAWLADIPGRSREIERHLGLEAGAASLEGIRLHTAADNRRLLDGPEPALKPILDRFTAFFAARGESPGDLGFLLEADLLP
jgi:NitT/TauT family transport system substrate-binding protein